MNTLRTNVLRSNPGVSSLVNIHISIAANGRITGVSVYRHVELRTPYQDSIRSTGLRLVYMRRLSMKGYLACSYVK